ncbi:unnamed protein product [Ranitomeya imitator]|uniref:Ig-like domain-containing protein n=1 Tax=Ranitomeya imitator TaxID=111125 RepID=A0ABN9M234_9NEOB|nr:unnamed protein product [Ranitomeya imitator]
MTQSPADSALKTTLRVVPFPAIFMATILATTVSVSFHNIGQVQFVSHLQHFKSILKVFITVLSGHNSGTQIILVTRNMHLSIRNCLARKTSIQALSSVTYNTAQYSVSYIICSPDTSYIRATMKKSHIVGILLLLCSGQVIGNSIEPMNSKIFTEEGKKITLSCSYKTSSSYSYLYWYRHYPGSAPQYIIRRINKGSPGDPAPGRFTSDVTLTSTELVISDVKTEDSATYLCALQAAQCDTSHLRSYISLVKLRFINSSKL